MATPIDYKFYEGKGCQFLSNEYLEEMMSIVNTSFYHIKNFYTAPHNFYQSPIDLFGYLENMSIHFCL